MQKETVEKILSQTKHGYDMISQKFSQTRKHFWRNLEFIGEYVNEEDNVLDYGCGNGRLLELIGNKNIKYVGLDISEQLIEDATETYGSEKVEFKKISPSQISLAFPDANFNNIYSIAVFHHFPSQKYREDIAKELFRVTKSGGYVVITVWNLWQPRYRKNIWQNWKNKIRAHIGGSTSIREVEPPAAQLDWNDCYISFTDNEGKKFERFHHAFTKRELKKLFTKAGFEIEKCEIVDGRNILLIGKKLN